jgi:hypothetical protein
MFQNVRASQLVRTDGGSLEVACRSRSDGSDLGYAAIGLLIVLSASMTSICLAQTSAPQTWRYSGGEVAFDGKDFRHHRAGGSVTKALQWKKAGSRYRVKWAEKGYFACVEYLENGLSTGCYDF